MDFASVANAFVGHYFPTFDDASRRPSLASLYKPESMLTWEGSAAQGSQAIMKVLSKPELKDLKTRITSTDAQPAPHGGVTIQVTGTMAVDQDFSHPMSFARTFALLPIPGQPGGFFIYNDIFRIQFG